MEVHDLAASVAMNYLAIVLIAAVAVAAAAVLLLKKRANGRNSLTGALPYYARKPLTDAERAVYQRLTKAVPERIILSQVALHRLLRVRKGHPSAAWFANAISKKTLDFVVCARNFGIVAAIELDDGSTPSPAVRASNALKEKALEAAGVTLLRWQVHALPEESAIRAVLSSQRSKRPQLQGHESVSALDTQGPVSQFSMALPGTEGPDSQAPVPPVAGQGPVSREAAQALAAARRGKGPAASRASAPADATQQRGGPASEATAPAVETP